MPTSDEKTDNAHIPNGNKYKTTEPILAQTAKKDFYTCLSLV